MGHDIHFLERLERLSMPQSDFALALYRDPDLVRYVLTFLKLPDGVERVALALEQGPNTPHIIMARDGGFVTCLGKDMSVGDHVVIPRERLDRLSADWEGLRTAVARVRNTGHARQLFRRLYRSGPALPREDMRTLRALYPLQWPEMFRDINDLADRLQDFRARYRRTRYSRLSSAALESLRGYWEASWALGHLVALHGTVLREILEPRVAALPMEEQMGFCVSWFSSRTLNGALALRGAWAAASAGHHLLPAYKHKFEECSTITTFLDSVLGLLALGLRHRRLRGEVRKVLARRRNPIFSPDPELPSIKFIQVLLPLYESVLDSEDALREMHRKFATEVIERIRAGAPADHPIHAITTEDLLEDFGLVLPMLEDTRLFGEWQSHVAMTFLLPWAIDADIEQLYLRSEHLAWMDLGFQPERVLAHLDDHAQYTFRSIPRRSEARPGRNEPCSCGSGKKYKRCCGAAGASS
jgi:hypothetical protein